MGRDTGSKWHDCDYQYMQRNKYLSETSIKIPPHVVLWLVSTLSSVSLNRGWYAVTPRSYARRSILIINCTHPCSPLRAEEQNTLTVPGTRCYAHHTPLLDTKLPLPLPLSLTDTTLSHTHPPEKQILCHHRRSNAELTAQPIKTAASAATLRVEPPALPPVAVEQTVEVCTVIVVVQVPPLTALHDES